MRMLVITFLIFFSQAILADELKEDVKKIIESVTRGSEKPFINQGACCPVCKEADKVRQDENCIGVKPIKSFEKNAKKRDDYLVLISGDRYEARMARADGTVFIVNRETLIKYFTLSPDGGDFLGKVEKTGENKDGKFMREYQKLEDIYGDIKFAELCRYLTKNRPKYEEIKSRKL